MDVNKYNAKDFAIVWMKVLNMIKKDPLKNFIRAKGFMDFKPTAAQEVIMKIIFGQDLDSETLKRVRLEEITQNKMDILELERTEYEIFEMMTGKQYVKKDESINKINLICGRRSGKTTLSAMIAILCAISTNWKQYLSKTPYATVLILSHSKEFSAEVLDIISEFINNSPILSRFKKDSKGKQTASAINLQIPFIENNKIVYSKVQIKVGAASKKTTRGVAACAVLADEIAYWNLDENSKESDKEVIRAVSPAMKQFGDAALFIKLSSPGLRQGVLYEEYEKYQRDLLPDSYVVFKAPSWVMNTILPIKEFIDEYKVDPDSFDVEYRANFTDALSNFILPNCVDECLNLNVDFLTKEDDPEVKYFGAIDAAFKNDTFTFSLVGIKEGLVTQYISKGWTGSRKEPVKAREVAKWIYNATKGYDLPQIDADQFAFQPLREIFDEYGLVLRERTFSSKWKKQIYFNLKKLIHSRQILLLDNNIQTKEIKELVVEQSTTGNIKIGHPSTGSDDYADSLAMSSYIAVEENGLIKVDFDTAMDDNRYGIQVDANTGAAVTAPSVDILIDQNMLSDQITDNSHEYGIDPEDGVFKRRTEFENEKDEKGPSFAFV